MKPAPFASLIETAEQRSNGMKRERMRRIDARRRRMQGCSLSDSSESGDSEMKARALISALNAHANAKLDMRMSSDELFSSATSALSSLVSTRIKNDFVAETKEAVGKLNEIINKY